MNLCYFSFMRKRVWRKLEKIGDIPLTCTFKEIHFNRKRSFYYSYQQTFCISNTHSLFMFCTQKHLSNVTHKRTSSGDKDFLLHLANWNWFDYLENVPELSEMLSFKRIKVSHPNIRIKTFGLISRFSQYWAVVSATCNFRKIQFSVEWH